MYFIEKYFAFWEDTFNLKKIYSIGGNKNYLKLTNIFIFWYLKFFLLYSIFVDNNLEFAGYILFYSVLVFVINYFAKNFLAKYYITYLTTSVFLIFHLIGGLFYVNGIRIYDYYLFGTIRYDWIIHTIGGFLSAFIAYDFVKSFFIQKVTSKMLFVCIILTLAVGIGTYNEIFEFLAVIFLGAEKGVGNYYNNLGDIMNNLLGSSIAVLFMLKHKMYK